MPGIGLSLFKRPWKFSHQLRSEVGKSAIERFAITSRDVSIRLSLQLKGIVRYCSDNKALTTAHLLWAMALLWLRTIHKVFCKNYGVLFWKQRRILVIEDLSNEIEKYCEQWRASNRFQPPPQTVCRRLSFTHESLQTLLSKFRFVCC